MVARTDTKNLPSKAEALDLLHSLPLPPTMIVDSGGGYHAYVLFKEPWVFEGEADREKARSLLQRFEAIAKRSAADKGWHMDGVADLARILRLPGTFNCKGAPEPVRILELNENLRVNPSEVCDILDLHAPEPKPVDRASVELTPNPGRTLSMAPRADAELLYAGCPWLANLKANPASQSEPQWHAALTLLSRCENATAVCHEFSKDYPGYAFEETEKKIRHAEASPGPRTCAAIEKEDLTSKFCESCEHRGRIQSPLQLGFPDAVEQAMEVIRSALESGTKDALLAQTTLDAVKTLKFRDAGLYALVEPDFHLALEAAGIGRASFKTAVSRKGTVTADRRKPVTTSKDTLYEAKGDGLYWRKASQEGIDLVRLTNFTAFIKEETAVIGRLEESSDLRIEGQIEGRDFSFKISSLDFQQMKWPLQLIGPRAVIHVGNGFKERTLVAIQMLSEKIMKSKIFTATGWWPVSGGFAYLHAEGGIGADGPTKEVSVDLPIELSRFQLPAPAEGTQLVRCYQALRDLMDLGPRAIMCPLIALAFRSVLGTTDFSLHLFGMTGTGKSELAALIQQHFGHDFSRFHLPASWSSTDNAIEAVAFVVKDAVLVVDDLVAAGTLTEASAAHRKAERVFRSQGNLSGRKRLSQTSQLKATYYPRGAILSTGEENLRGHSIRARVLTIEVSRGAVHFDRLASLQDEAKAGTFSALMAAYVRYLAPNYEKVRAALRDQVTAVRRDLEETDHKRTAAMCADLIVGANTMLQFLRSEGAIEDDEMISCSKEFRAAILDAAKLHETRNQEANPAQRFLSLLRSVLLSGRARIQAPSGSPPHVMAFLGCPLGSAPGPGTNCEAIGRLDEDLVYLDPPAAFAVVQSLAKEGGEPILESADTVWSRMRDQGMLARTGGSGDEDRNTVRKQFDRVRSRYVCIHIKTLMPADGEEDA